jgi:hypothetical protein
LKVINKPLPEISDNKAYQLNASAVYTNCIYDGQGNKDLMRVKSAAALTFCHIRIQFLRR